MNKILVVAAAVVVVVVRNGVNATATTTTTTTTTTSTPGIKTVPPPTPGELKRSPKDCPLYVFGILQTIRKHGDTWVNDANGCELCECVEGLKRCYYHYCNQGTEIVTNPPLALPPWDDEDRGLDEEWGEWEEGSGRPPPYYYKGYPKSPDVRARTRANDTPPLVFCDGHCEKKCVFGYKINRMFGCRECICRTGRRGGTRACSPITCKLACRNGYKVDERGCEMCECKEELGNTKGKCLNNIEGCMDGETVRVVGEVWSRGACVKCGCIMNGYTECNVTHCSNSEESLPPCPRHYSKPAGGAVCCPSCRLDTDMKATPEVTIDHVDVTVMSGWERDPQHQAPPPGAPRDGAVKSAVQAEVLTWWQLMLIMLSVAAVVVAVVCVTLKRHRRTDKYDINTYNSMTHNVRHVATPDHIKGRLM